MDTQKIYRLCFNGAPAAPDSDRFISVPSLKSLLESAEEPAPVLLDGLSTDSEEGTAALYQSLKTLRASQCFYAAPLFFSKSMGEMDSFADGVSDVPEKLSEFSERILSRLGTLKMDLVKSDPILRFLAYLYSRGENFTASPIKAAFSPWGYGYPASALFSSAEILREQAEDHYRHPPFDSDMLHSFRMLHFLTAQGFLAESEQISRIRLCPHCGTGHLNYVDCCPHCGSIDFEKTSIIHCFTCGNVAPEQEYKKGMLLVCPRCNTRLHHLGSDYDHPMENYVCRRCGSKFIEPEVKAQCFFCGHVSTPDELTVRPVFSYRLTELGKTSVRLGSVTPEFVVFDRTNNATLSYFCHMSDWLVQLRKRYPEEDFSILGVKIYNFDRSGLSLQNLDRLVSSLSRRIRELIRTTDVIASTSIGVYWILLPRTPEANGEILAGRIRALSDLVIADQSYKIRIKARAFAIPTTVPDEAGMTERCLTQFEDILENLP